MEALWLRLRESGGGAEGLGHYNRRRWLDFISHLRPASIVGQSSRALIALYVSTFQSQSGNTSGIYALYQSSLQEVLEGRDVHWDHSNKELMCK